MRCELGLGLVHAHMAHGQHLFCFHLLPSMKLIPYKNRYSSLHPMDFSWDFQTTRGIRSWFSNKMSGKHCRVPKGKCEVAPCGGWVVGEELRGSSSQVEQEPGVMLLQKEKMKKVQLLQSINKMGCKEDSRKGLIATPPLPCGKKCVYMQKMCTWYILGKISELQK